MAQLQQDHAFLKKLEDELDVDAEFIENASCQADAIKYIIGTPDGRENRRVKEVARFAIRKKQPKPAPKVRYGLGGKAILPKGAQINDD